MSLNVTYDQCYYGIVKMRDETETRIHLLHTPFLTRPASVGREIWKNGESRRGLHSAVCRPRRGNGAACRCKSCFFHHRPRGRIRLSCLLA